VLDVGIQTAMNGNQSTILSLAPQAISRTNTIYRSYILLVAQSVPSRVVSPGIILAGRACARSDSCTAAPRFWCASLRGCPPIARSPLEASKGLSAANCP
jgi:hypothetical protein